MLVSFGQRHLRGTFPNAYNTDRREIQVLHIDTHPKQSSDLCSELQLQTSRRKLQEHVNVWELNLYYNPCLKESEGPVKIGKVTQWQRQLYRQHGEQTARV